MVQKPKDNFFGGLFDFDGDGKTSFAEKATAYEIFRLAEEDDKKRREEEERTEHILRRMEHNDD